MPTQLINRNVKLEICVPDREENYKHLSVLVTQLFGKLRYLSIVSTDIY